MRCSAGAGRAQPTATARRGPTAPAEPEDLDAKVMAQLEDLGYAATTGDTPASGRLDHLRLRLEHRLGLQPGPGGEWLRRAAPATAALALAVAVLAWRRHRRG